MAVQFGERITDRNQAVSFMVHRLALSSNATIPSSRQVLYGIVEFRTVFCGVKRFACLLGAEVEQQLSAQSIKISFKKKHQ